MVSAHLRSRVDHDRRRRDSLFDVNVLDLPPTTASVPVARRFVRARLLNGAAEAAGAADGSADVDIVTLLVSEVVTNAVLHARSTVTLTVDVAEEGVRISVRDGSPVRPRMHPFAPTSATGRGMLLLDRLAKRWGVDADPVTGGKVVWFEVGGPSTAAWGEVSEHRLNAAIQLGRLG
jgi:anti-sigma regulatory factor (Ser/Thr protein kinase)